MKGIIGKKVGMTSIFTEEGKQLPCTVIQAGPCVVTQVKTEETDGYTSVQLGFDSKKEKNTSAGLKGHFAKAGVEPVKKLVEFRNFDIAVAAGETVSVEIFEEGDVVNVVGTSKGKGFQGVVKRHGFAGVGDATHGQHNRLRAPGSVGGASYPAKVFKGMRMAGRMGTDRVKVKNLNILKVMTDKNLLVVSGAVPGPKGGYVIIEG